VSSATKATDLPFTGLPRDVAAPNELKAIPQWVAWRYEDRGGSKPTKPPVNPHTGGYASCDSPATWGTYEQAERRAREDGLPGVGFVLSEDDNLTGYDFDGCRNPTSGKLKPWVQEILSYGETYAEISPSGTGIRLIARGKIAAVIKYDPAKVEVYGHGRYLTITGQRLDRAPDAIGPAPKTKASCRERVKLHNETWAALKKAGPKLFGKGANSERGEAKREEAKTGKRKRGVLWEAVYGFTKEPFFRNANDAALQNLSAWVPAVFGAKARRTNLGYRVSSFNLGRNLQEDLSLTPQGIKDWGVHDLGDAKNGGRTPIDVVLEHGSKRTAADAALWLCDELGIDPASLGWRDSNLDDDRDLAVMNAIYAVVKVGGKTRVVELEESPTWPGCRVPVFSTIPDFCAFHAKRKKEISTEHGTKQVGLGKWWIDHPQRRQFDRVAYLPNVNNPHVLNLWTGFAVEPKEADCGLYLTHLKENICDGDIGHYEYALNWMARAVQFPGHQGEVAIVLRGKEGTGKGVAAKEFGRLFGPHLRHVVHAKHLTGHFNAHLQHCSILFADEAFFAGDRAHESILKALITEETLLIEPKGLDPFPVRNCIHLIMSSNSDWVIPAGADARRYFVLDVGDLHMQDHAYFAAIAQQMENGGREALLHLLLNRYLAGFNIRAVPQTAALARQKQHSRRGVDRLIEIIAHDGRLPSAHETYPNIAVTTGADDLKGFTVTSRVLVPDLKYESPIIIGNKLRDDWGCARWHSNSQRGFKFPPLKELRRRFEERHGQQDWSGEVTEWSP